MIERYMKQQLINQVVAARVASCNQHTVLHQVWNISWKQPCNLSKYSFVQVTSGSQTSIYRAVRKNKKTPPHQSVTCIAMRILAYPDLNSKKNKNDCHWKAYSRHTISNALVSKPRIKPLWIAWIQEVNAIYRQMICQLKKMIKIIDTGFAILEFRTCEA